MQLKHLSIRNFRNYEALELDFAPGLSVFAGENAQGKTNLLEAIHVMSTGRSHRTRQDREMIYHDENMVFAQNAYLHTVCNHRDGNHDIEVLINQHGKKAIRINHSPISRMGDLMGHITSVLFSPGDLNLIHNGPSERRRFMNMTLSQITKNYFFTLQQYQKALLQRNELLKQIIRENKDESLLEIWDEQLVQKGASLTIQRSRYVDFLSENANRIHRELTNGKENLMIVYDSSVSGTEGERENQLSELLRNSKVRDLRLGMTTQGPHRDDLVISINGADARTEASQGQCRTAILSIKLAELELMKQMTGEAPILLLDDVFSELDGARREMLQAYIGKVQTIITCVDLESQILNKDVVSIYKVRNGKVSQ